MVIQNYVQEELNPNGAICYLTISHEYSSEYLVEPQWAST